MIKIFFVSLFLSLLAFSGINSFQGNLERFFYAQISQSAGQIIEIELSQKPLLELEAKSAISIKISEFGREKTVFKKNTLGILPLASLTKLMTALIILENPEDFNFSKTLTISKNAADQGDTPNFGNLKTGQKYALGKLFELMLVYSSNDAAFSLSEVIGTENFVDKMNQKAEELGLLNTYFVNPTGLDSEDLNYSTVKDLVKLAQYILENQPSIFELSSQSQNDNSIENGLSNLNLHPGQKLIGGKTGFTKNAGGCILFVFQNENGNIFINVILGTEKEGGRIEEMQKLIDWIGL
jgi:serine-type D-Ala-D-Ala carboxypeptidase (penicillin-binding protein 5/6)